MQEPLPLTARELILNGSHREAVFWMVATFARATTYWRSTGRLSFRSSIPAFDAILADLGITSTDDLSRADEVLHFLPKLWSVTESILDANPNVTGERESTS